MNEIERLKVENEKLKTELEALKNTANSKDNVTILPTIKLTQETTPVPIETYPNKDIKVYFNNVLSEITAIYTEEKILINLNEYSNVAGYQMTINPDSYKGIRLNTYNESYLLLPGSKYVIIYTITNNNYKKTEDDGLFHFEPKEHKLSCPVSDNNGNLYAPIDFLNDVLKTVLEYQT